MPFKRHDDFDHNTAYGARCTCCGNIKQQRHKSVFRPDIMDDFDGFHDVCEDCISQAADELDFTTPQFSKSQGTRIKNLQTDLSEAQSMYIESQETIRNLCREVSNLQEELANLTNAFETVE
jgi:hypothetical protein